MANYLITPTMGWRWMFVTGGIGALFVWFTRRALPESPRWLEIQGRFAEAEAVIREIEGASYQPCELVGGYGPIPPPNVSLWALFSPNLIRITVISLVTNIVLMFTVWLFNGGVPTFLVRQGLSVASSLSFVATMSAGSLIGP